MHQLLTRVSSCTPYQKLRFLLLQKYKQRLTEHRCLDRFFHAPLFQRLRSKKERLRESGTELSVRIISLFPAGKRILKKKHLADFFPCLFFPVNRRLCLDDQAGRKTVHVLKELIDLILNIRINDRRLIGRVVFNAAFPCPREHTAGHDFSFGPVTFRPGKKVFRIFLPVRIQGKSCVQMPEKLALIGMDLPEKIKRNFDAQLFRKERKSFSLVIDLIRQPLIAGKKLAHPLLPLQKFSTSVMK